MALVDEIKVNAVVENLDKVQGFIDERLEAADCSPKAQMQIALSVEEIFVNIAHYAYKGGEGDATIRISIDDGIATVTFIDSGIQYDPLANDEPDVTLSAEEREIGGLGIFITRKSMDEVSYEYKDGHNVLTLTKKI